MLTERNTRPLAALVPLLLALALVASACLPLDGSSERDTDDLHDTAGDTTATDLVSDTVDDVPQGPAVTALFDLEAARSGPATFYDFPFPSDLRTTADGRPDMTGFPASSSTLVRTGIALVGSENVGFSPNGATYFRFDAPLDESRLPTDPRAALSADAPAQIIDIDPSSPTYGERLPAIVTFRALRSAFWRSNMVAVRTVTGLDMRPGTRYAVILTDALRGAEDGPVRPAESFLALRTGSDGVDSELASHYAELFARLEDVGVDLDRVVAATALTTSDVARQMDALREAVIAHPSFEVTNWEKVSDGVYAGTFETLEFFGPGEPPYTNVGEGRFEFDAQGRPLNGVVRQVRFAISVPQTAQPAAGYPIVVYGHGTGGDFETHLGPSGEGSFLALEGLATIGFDAALHGTRVASPIEVESLIASNPIAAREVVRQTVVDTIVAYRLLDEGAFEIPASVTGGEPIRFDVSRGLYLGHSQGAQQAGLLAGVEPRVRAAFLSAGGAGIVISIRERQFNGQPIACLLALLVGVQSCSELTPEHPVLTQVVQPIFDGADPLNYARRFIKEPLPGHPRRHIVMSQGTIDTFTPPRAQDALAATIGLPLIEPVVRTSEPLDILSPPRQQAPLSLNLEVDGERVTAGMVQWAGEGHFAIYRSGEARRRYIEFLKSAATGTPTLVGSL